MESPATILVPQSSPARREPTVASSLTGELARRFPWLLCFADPPVSHRPQPFFVWNGDVTEARITEVLEQFKARGCGGAFIHPRPGLITEYLSDRWFELWAHALAEAKRLGLECHLYDENGYPSGFAGGHVVASNPFTVRRTLRVERWEETDDWTGQETVVRAFRLEANGRPVALAPGQRGDAASPETEVWVVRLVPAAPRAFSASFPEVDLSLPETTATFLATTHERYAARFAGDFGKTIKYCFTDEPNVGGPGGPIASPYLFAEFWRDHDYDLRERVEALFYDVPGGEEVRYDYRCTLNRLWVRNFLQPVHAWCEHQGLLFTGHFWEHMWPDPLHQPDVMLAYRWLHVPGIDLLAFQFFPDDRQRTRITLLACKEVGSVARQLGRERVLAETTGGGGYDQSLVDFKPLTDFCQIYGVNLPNPHLSHQSLAGARKYDWGQTYSDHAAWWEDYRLEADHEARVSWTLSHGVERNRLLVLQPTTSAWLHRGAGDLGGQAMVRIREDQLSLIAQLTDAQVDFDLGDEFILAESGAVEDAALKVGHARYDVVLIPASCENLLAPTLALLRAFGEAGGRMLAAGEPRYRIDGRWGAGSETLRGVVEQVGPGDLVSRVRALLPPAIRHPSGAALPSGLCWTRRELGDGWTLHAFANPWTEPIDTEIVLEGQSLHRLDTLSGRIDPLPSRPQGSGRQVAGLALPFTGLELWLAGPEPSAAPSRTEVRRTVTRAVAALWTVEREQPNQLVVDYGTVRVGSRVHEHVHAARANVLAWQAHGRDGDPWMWGIQFRRTLVDQVFAPDSGLEFTQRFEIDPSLGASALAGLEVAVERAELYRIEVNDRLVRGPGTRWWDEAMSRLPIGPLCRHGMNTLRLRLSPFHALCELQPAYLCGEFAARPTERGFRIAPAAPLGFGDWREFGLGTYPWTVAYHAVVRLDAPAEGLRVTLGAWGGASVAVVLDGEPVGLIALPPPALTIARPLAAGEHHLTLRVRGHLKNAIGPHHRDELPVPSAWTYSPDAQPPGAAYRLVATGLFDQPRVEVLG